MAPEQLEGAESTPAVDIYSLGVILYQLLTARVPFQGPTFCDTAMMALRQEPTPPRRIQPRIPRDLETICLKCLEKDPQKRYRSAAMLADDLDRFLKGLPIQASATSVFGHATRWAKRNPWIAFLAAAVVLVGSAGLTGVLWNWKEARKNEQLARANALDAQTNAGVALEQTKTAQDAAEKERWERHRVSLLAASNALRLNDVNAARIALDSSPPKYRDWVWELLNAQLDKSQQVVTFEPHLKTAKFTPDRSWVLLDFQPDVYWLLNIKTRQRYGPYRRPNKLICSLISPEGSSYAYTTEEGTLVICDSTTGQSVRVIDVKRSLHDAVYHPDGKHITGLTTDNTIVTWDLINDRESLAFRPETENVISMTFSPSAKYAIVTTAATAQVTSRIWDLSKQKLIATLDVVKRQPHYVRFSPDEKQLMTGYGYPNSNLHLWETTTGTLRSTLIGHTNQLLYSEFSGDGERLVSTGMDRTVCVWNTSRESVPVLSKPLLELQGHTGNVFHAVFSPDGKRIVSSSQDCTLRYWNAENGKQLAVLHGHRSEVIQSEFVAGDDTILSVSPDNTVRYWSVTECENDFAVRGHTNFVYSVAVHPNNQRFASTAWDGTARVWDMRTKKELYKLDHEPNPIVASVAYHPNGKKLATLSRDGGVRLWDADTGKLLHQWPVPLGGCYDSRLAFSPDGKLLVAGNHTGLVTFWDLQTRQPLKWSIKQPTAVYDLAFSPDSRFLVVTTFLKEEAIWMWDIEKQELVRKFTQPVSGAHSVAWHRSGKTFAAGTEDGIVVLYNAETGEASKVMKHSGVVHGIAFHPNGKIFATACSDNLIRFWDVETQSLLAELKGHQSYVHCVAFSPDGTSLVSASGDTTLRVWDTLRQADRMKK
jgi:WD40 repeat protein